MDSAPGGLGPLATQYPLTVALQEDAGVYRGRAGVTGPEAEE